jgi:ATP-binding protein involved in chromosome partitioning
MSTQKDKVEAAVKGLKVEGGTLGELGVVGAVTVEEGKATVQLDLSRARTLRRESLGHLVREAAASVSGISAVDVAFPASVPGRAIASNDPLPEVKNVILVMSGKGGVGKSTTATNLALALKRMGMRVGLLDADIYGPSIPTMLGVSGRPVSLDGKSIEPLTRFGVKLMSIGFLLDDPKAAVVWRGPMLAGALQQFLRDVAWGALDFLVLDLPPGTGDVALTLSQQLRATGAVIVTTPQPVATDDVFKSVSMCEKVNIPVLGVVENMSYFVDTAGVRHELFGKGGGDAVAKFAKAPLLGQIPIDQSVREWGDRGTPVVQAAPESVIARSFVEVAERLADVVAERSGHGDGGDGGDGNGDDENAAPVIDRSGGSGGKRRLPVAK